jgi:hypothetical protein
MTLLEHGIYYLEIVPADARVARDVYSKALGRSFADAAPEVRDAFVAEIPGGSLCGI